MLRAAKAHVSRGGSGTDAWELATRLPAEPLRGYIRELNGYTERTPGPLRRWEFPCPQVVVILEIGPPIRVFDAGQDVTSCAYAGGFVAGLDDKASLTEHRGYQAGIQLNMTPIGARLVFGASRSLPTGTPASIWSSSSSPTESAPLALTPPRWRGR